MARYILNHHHHRYPLLSSQFPSFLRAGPWVVEMSWWRMEIKPVLELQSSPEASKKPPPVLQSP